MPPPRTATLRPRLRRRLLTLPNAEGAPPSVAAALAAAACCSSARREMPPWPICPLPKLTTCVVTIAYDRFDGYPDPRPAARLRRHQRRRPHRRTPREAARRGTRALRHARLRRDRRQGRLPRGRRDRPLLLRVLQRQPRAVPGGLRPADRRVVH